MLEKTLEKPSQKNKQDIAATKQKTVDMEKKMESIPTTPTAIAPVGSQVDEIDQRYRIMTLVINVLNTQYQTRKGVLGFGREMLKVNDIHNCAKIHHG